MTTREKKLLSALEREIERITALIYEGRIALARQRIRPLLKQIRNLQKEVTS